MQIKVRAWKVLTLWSWGQRHTTQKSIDYRSMKLSTNGKSDMMWIELCRALKRTLGDWILVWDKTSPGRRQFMEIRCEKKKQITKMRRVATWWTNGVLLKRRLLQTYFYINDSAGSTLSRRTNLKQLYGEYKSWSTAYINEHGVLVSQAGCKLR